MGICLDTDASAAQDTGEQGNEWSRTRNPQSANGRVGSANIAAIDIPNAGKIKFDPPKVPVIFVLGGPGSGKVTHCDTFMQERRGVTHINMMDLLQQYAMGNDMQDFSQLSSKTVTEVLMLEMKMAPAAKSYLISGYPRSMRDVVEYSEKIQVVNGVILISWRQSVLQKQIDYGAKLGHVVLSLAKMELENFFKNVMPVADYFDQSDMLLAVNGERAPTEVYKDFRTAVLDILSTLENQEAILNGVSGMGRGINDIPGTIVSVDTAPKQTQNIAEFSNANAANNPNNSDDRNDVTDAVIAHIASNAANANHIAATNVAVAGMQHAIAATASDQVITRQPVLANASTSMDIDEFSIPPVIWVVGGPGSNKEPLCLKAVAMNPGWGHISMGRVLRTVTESAPRANTDSYIVKESYMSGELVPEKALGIILHQHLNKMRDKSGIVLEGFPRNLQQVKYFENKYKQRPPMILLDCSKLQLGRGRVDDNVSSFRRRLEIFREETIPMLKAVDNMDRLLIVDGDTQRPSVQRNFEKTLRTTIQHMELMASQGHLNDSVGAAPYPQNISTNHITMMDSAVGNQTEAILHDLENNVPGAVPTISHHVSLMNGHLKNRNNSGTNNLNNNNNQKPMNGDARPGHAVDFRHMLEEAERYPVDSYM